MSKKATPPQANLDKFVILQDAPEKIPEKTTGLIITELEKNVQRNTGIIKSIGPTAVTEYAVGDHVAFGEYAGTEVTKDGITYLIMKNMDILCKL